MGGARNGGDAGTEWIDASLRLRIDGEPVQIRLRMPSGGAAPEALLPVLWQLEQGLIDAAIDRLARAGESVSCRPGCARCCRQLVPISRTEAHHLAAVVAAMPTAQRERTEHRFAEGIERITRAGLLDRCRSLDRLDGAALRELGVAWFGLDLACPFLEEESCAIHPQRPLACREYLVSSPAAHCAHPSPQTVRLVPLGGRLSSAAALLDGAAREAGSHAVQAMAAAGKTDAPTAAARAQSGPPRLGLPLLFALDAAARGAAPPAIPQAPLLLRRVIESMAGRAAAPPESA